MHKVQLSSVYDSLLKARNCMNGLKEHIICYISSGRSHIVSDLISQLGGKGRRKYIDEIIRNSEITGKFQEPKKKLGQLLIPYNTLSTIKLVRFAIN